MSGEKRKITKDSNSVLAFLLDKGYIKSLNNYKTLQELYTGIDSYLNAMKVGWEKFCEFSKRLQAASLGL